MKSFVVMTYYQLMHSIAMGLTLEEKPALYFSKQYMDVDEAFLDRIRGCGVFSHVTGITGRGDFKELAAELEKTKDYTPEEIDRVGSSIFDKYLEPYYEPLFADADKHDTIFIYNDFHWHYYYIHKHFDEIVGAEDGYGSLKQQFHYHRLRGDHVYVEKYLGKYYPEPLYRSPKVKKIISSLYFDDIPQDYKDRVEVLDFNDLVKKNQERFSDALLHIFDIETLRGINGGVIFLGQCLSRAEYCNTAEEYLFNKKIVQTEADKGFEVYYKPHPADTVPALAYETEHIHVLPQLFPVEALNYLDCTFDKALSFASTSVSTLSCVKSAEKQIDPGEVTIPQLMEHIQKEIKKERIILDIYMIVRELTTDTLINVFSCMLPRKRIKVRVHAVVPTALEEAAQAFFAQDLSAAAEAYRASHTIRGKCPWDDMLAKLEARKEKLKCPMILACEDPDDEEAVFSLCAKQQETYDYLMMADGNNLMFSLMKNLAVTLHKKLSLAVAFQRYTRIPHKKVENPVISLSPGFIGEVISGDLTNRLWHRNVVKRFFDGDALRPENERARILYQLRSTIRRFSNDLYVPADAYLAVNDGKEHYLKLAEERMDSALQDKEFTHARLAMTVYEYLDWYRIRHPAYDAGVIGDFVDALPADALQKQKLLEQLIASLLFERTRRFGFVYGKKETYKEYLLRTDGK